MAIHLLAKQVSGTKTKALAVIGEFEREMQLAKDLAE